MNPNEKKSENIIYVESNFLDNLLLIENIDIVIWAQGHNFNDNINSFNKKNFEQMIDGNVSFIIQNFQKENVKSVGHFSNSVKFTIK